MNYTLTHALKEWATAVEALEQGKTILLLRKGGIKEDKGRFDIQHQQILLYPTYEHQNPTLLKPEYAQNVTPVDSGWHPESVKIGSWAEISDILTVSEENAVNNLLSFHIWNENFVHDRFNWKPKQPLYLLLLKVYLLPHASILPYHSEYGGCKSWIDVLKPISLVGSIPVLSEDEYNQQVEKIRQTITINY